MAASSRNSGHYQDFPQRVEDANPDGQIVIITDNLDHPGDLGGRWVWRGSTAWQERGSTRSS
jgi:hypothetical protein